MKLEEVCVFILMVGGTANDNVMGVWVTGRVLVKVSSGFFILQMLERKEKG